MLTTIVEIIGTLKRIYQLWPIGWAKWAFKLQLTTD